MVHDDSLRDRSILVVDSALCWAEGDMTCLAPHLQASRPRKDHQAWNSVLMAMS